MESTGTRKTHDDDNTVNVTEVIQSFPRSEANDQYVNENYQKAAELYTEVLKLDEKRDDVYCYRAQTYFQMGLLAEAVQDYDRALELNDSNNKAYVKKGTVLFEMNQVEKALQTFKDGQIRFDSDPVLEDWIHKCESQLSKSGPEDTPSGDQVKQSANTTENSIPSKEDVPPPAETSKIKYNWYQTHTHVVVTIMAKNVKQENFDVVTEERNLKVSIRECPDTPSTLDLVLAHQIDPQQTSTKMYSTKVEIKLKKKEGLQWRQLEGALEKEAKESHMATAAPIKDEPPRYPSSSHYTRDWDKLAAQVTEEEKNEKLEGDAALNQFFQKIYQDATDDTRKAMMKSFTESAGTVLSTNWQEVGAKKVDVKPPDGMEYKKWEA